MSKTFRELVSEVEVKGYTKTVIDMHKPVEVADYSQEPDNFKTKAPNPKVPKGKVNGRQASTSDVEKLGEAYKPGPVKLQDGSTAELTSETAEAVNHLLKRSPKMENVMLKNSHEFESTVEFALQVGAAQL